MSKEVLRVCFYAEISGDDEDSLQYECMAFEGLRVRRAQDGSVEFAMGDEMFELTPTDVRLLAELLK